MTRILQILMIAFTMALALKAMANCRLHSENSQPQQAEQSMSKDSQSAQINKQPTVSGTVFYLQRMALPPDASVHVKLVDISKQDVAAVIIAEQIIRGPGQVPIPFELRFDPAKIDPRLTYAVQVRITSGAKLLFITTRVFPVITRGHPTRLEVKVDPVK